MRARPGHRAGGFQGEHSLQVPRAPHPPDPHQGGAASGLGGYADPDPPELEEAALVDGCTRRQAFRRIVFPLLAPGVMVTSLFGFITIWNEVVFVNALMQSPENSTLPRWISAFQTVLGTDWGATMAASTLFTLPVIAVFAILQRRAVGGLAAGAAKG